MIPRLPQWLSGKESSCNAGDLGDTGSIPGLERSPGEWNGNPFQYSCLENSMDRGVSTGPPGKSWPSFERGLLQAPSSWLVSLQGEMKTWRKQEESHVMTETETGVMPLNKECWQPSESRRGKNSPLESLEGVWACRHLNYKSYLQIYQICSRSPQIWASSLRSVRGTHLLF